MEFTEGFVKDVVANGHHPIRQEPIDLQGCGLYSVMMKTVMVKWSETSLNLKPSM